jgi:hypothetical protein
LGKPSRRVAPPADAARACHHRVFPPSSPLLVRQPGAFGRLYELSRQLLEGFVQPHGDLAQQPNLLGRVWREFQPRLSGQILPA